MRKNEFRNADFIKDEEKMRDFKNLSKEDFLKTYDYLTEEEYDNTYNKYYSPKNTFCWISIEEALPEEDKNVLLTFLAYPDYKEPSVDNGFAYLHNGEWYWLEEDENECRQKIKVPILAWMAIEPYKKEENNNKNINSEEEKEMKILLKEDLKAKLDEICWSAYENEKDVDFSTCTASGGDIDIVIDKGENLTDLAHNIYEYWNNYDVSYETSLWIGEDGHGINGAPYDIKELYEDMEGVKNMINDLYNIINKEAKKETEKKQIYRYTLKDKIRELFNTLNGCKQRLTELKKEVGDPVGTSNIVTKDDNLIYDIENHLKTLEDYAEMSEGYSDFLESLNHISATQLKRIVDNYEVLVNHYKEHFPWRNGVTTVEDFKEDLKPLLTFVDKITINKRCPKCGELLLKSDLPQYNYVCPLCEENFYDGEVK